MKQYFCVGTYTESILFGTGERFQGKGKGVLICSLEDGEVTVISTIKVRNPSYLCLDEAGRKIYAVNEMKEYMGGFGGGVTQLSYDKDWNLTVERTGNTGGADPCHIFQDPNHEFLSIANFASGSVTIVPVNRDGSMDTEHRLLFGHEGKSIHPVRQQGPHAHATIKVPGEKRLLVPDLGTDTIYSYRYERGCVEADPAGKITAPAGSGPRTGVFSQDGRNFYLICEISSQVIHFQYKNGVMEKQGIFNTLPEDNTADNICSDIHLTPDGAYLYASNRGHDSIVSFRVCGDGSLEFIQWQSCRGKTPRNFAIDPTGTWLLCGNQDSDTISVFAINPDGTLKFKKKAVCETPACIRFFHDPPT